ncbi:unnamed protein product [Prunus brigantina]
MNMISIILLLWRIIILSCCYGAAATSAASAPIAKPNCTTHCGDVAIPYPFGIGPNKDCYLDEWFQIDCRHDNSITSANYSRQVPFLKRVNLELLSIYPFEYGTQLVQVKNPISFFSCEGKKTRHPQNLKDSPFIYSQRDNIFIAVGCDLLARMSSDYGPVAECWSICNTTDGDNGPCYDDNLPRYELTNFSIDEIPLNSSTSDAKGDCKCAFLVDEYWFVSYFRDVKDMDSVPVVLDWMLNVHDYGERFRENPDLTGNQSTPICTLSTSELTNKPILICDCPWGTEGNPYLLQPCQDIDECKGRNECGGNVCENFAGGYSCYSNITGGTCTYLPKDIAVVVYSIIFGFRNDNGYNSIPIDAGLGSGVGLLLLLIGAWLVHKIVKIKKTIARKKMFFKRNGGLLLEKLLSSGEVNVDKIKLFNSK